MRIALRDGLVLHARSLGRGDPVAVLVHGFAGSADAWGEPLLLRLSDEMRVIAVDLPGHGRSAKPHDAGRYGVDELVTDLIELLDSLAVPRALWIGYSMGGRAALAVALRHPDRVASLLLEGASPGIADPGRRAERLARDDAVARLLLDRGIEAFADYWQDLAVFASRRALPASVQARVRRRVLDNDPAALAAVLRGFGRGAQPSFWEELPTLRANATLLVGALDEKSHDIARRMAGVIPHGNLVSVPGVGHSVHLENADAWLEAVYQHRSPIT